MGKGKRFSAVSQRPLDNVLLLLLQNSETKIWEFVSASYSRGGGTKMRDIEKK